MMSGGTAADAIVDAGLEQLQLLNAIVRRAVSAWPMPDRVKRLALPTLQYDAVDFAHYEALLYCGAGDGDAVACAVWLNQQLDFGHGYCGGLLHGLYVDPIAQRQKIGSKLLLEVFARATAAGLGGMMVRAERVSQGFFERSGMVLLPQSAATDYPHRYWKQLNGLGQAAPPG